MPQSDVYNPIERVERAFTTEQYQEFFEENLNRLNQDQKQVFDNIIQATTTRNHQAKCFFLDGPGGTGKTFLIQVWLRLLNFLLAFMLCHNCI